MTKQSNTPQENVEARGEDESNGWTPSRRTVLKAGGLAGLSATALSTFTSTDQGVETPAIDLYQLDGISSLHVPRSVVRRGTRRSGVEPVAAPPIDMKSIVSASLNERGVEWHAFEAKVVDELTIEIARDTSDGLLSLLLYGPNGDFLTMEFLAGQSSVQLPVIIRTNGTHYVQLIGDGVGPFSLAMREGTAAGVTTATSKRVWLEAERAADCSNFEPFVVESDDDASNDRYIEVPLEGRQADSPPDDGHANYMFDVDQADDYVIWGRCIAPDRDANSFWVSVDGGTEHEWWVNKASNGGNTDWQWFTVNDRNTETYPVIYSLGAGSHTLSVKWREDGTKLDKLLVTNDMEFTPSGTGGDTTGEQTPYVDNGVPGTIQAEDYDEGGEGVAYHDVDEENRGGAYRDDGVDIQVTEGGGYNIGWLEDDEWLEYTVDVEAGTYDLTFRVASPYNDRSLRVLLDDTDLGTIGIPNTGGWQAWETVTLSGITLSGGSNRVLRLEVGGGGECNVDWFAFVSADETTATPTSTPISSGEGTVSGERKTWHRVAVTFDGPDTSEGASTNPFLDYRMTVTFTGPSGQVYEVPGHYAADGNAAETSASSGDKWRAHFTPDEAGEWTYQTSFVEGSNVAVDGGGTATAFDGDSGGFVIDATEKSGRDLRGKGRLEYVDDHYLRFAESGDYFLKNGAGAPENFLGYYEFDQTESLGGSSPNTSSNLHEYGPHEADWTSGDPTWQSGKGKSILGAVNYLATEGLNSVYMLTYNIDGGDGQDVWPWTANARDSKRRFDVSKLDQWERLFHHMTQKGFNLHLVLQERENDTAINNGDLGTERKLYYRELISRFAHHPAITWNLGEETDLTTTQIETHAQFFTDTDPYGHQVVVHTLDNEWDDVYDPLLGTPDFDGPSIQNDNDLETNAHAVKWRQDSAATGRPWPVNIDEIGHYKYALPCDGNTLDGNSQADYRTGSLWPGYMGGGAGLAWYFGQKTCQDDRTLEDFRTRDTWWTWTRYAHTFFTENVAFENGTPDNDALGNASGYVFADAGTWYVVYLPDGTDNATLDTTTDDYDRRWYDPQTGQFTGGTTTLEGGSNTRLGDVPDDISEDAVALLTVQ